MKSGEKIQKKPKVTRQKRESHSDSSSIDDDRRRRSSGSSSSSSSDSDGDNSRRAIRKKARKAGVAADAIVPPVRGAKPDAAGTGSGADRSSPSSAQNVCTSAAHSDGGAGAETAAACHVTAADAATAKRARADAVMARLTAKLEAATDPRKRLALQTKMLRLLSKCTPQPPQPAPQPAAQRVAMTAPAGQAGSSGAASPKGSNGFQFKLQRTPKAAIMRPVGAQLSGPEEEARRRMRQQRFAGVDAGQQGGEQTDAALVDSGGLGTCEALEKEYLRLTSLPRASDVRPPPVLAAALRLVKAKWLQRPDYAAASEQLKAIRQDLTVQHVRDTLTVDVYETHGRLALETDDFAEFRRCHAVLRQLYREGVPGNHAEFEAYGLLYTQATAAARNTLALELGRVPEQLLGHSFVRHALNVCAAARSGNYSRFIALYDGAPRMSPYLMDRLLSKMRLLALQSTVMAFKPLPVPLEYLAGQMGVETEAEAAAVATQLGAMVDLDSRCLDTRASAAQPLGPPRPPDGPS